MWWWRGMVVGSVAAVSLDELPARFLRENLKQSWDESSLQRLVRNVPADLEVAEWENKEGYFEVRFSDGSSGDYYPPPENATKVELEAEGKVLWGDPSEVERLLGMDWSAGGLRFAWGDLAIEETEAAVKASGLTAEQLNQGRAVLSGRVAAARAALVRAVHVYGVASIRGAPAEADVTRRLADAVVGAVETTNFGYKFVIKAVAKPHNLAYDNIGLQQHTDFTYCAKVPDIGVFHCIEPAPVGGDSLWLDGFAAADALDDDQRRLLAETPVSHLDITDMWDLRATHPTLQYDDAGTLKRVFFNERTRDSWRQFADTKRTPSQDFYAALAAYEAEVDRPDRMLNTPLDKGDIVLFDNARVMHSRKPFVGGRHMEGSYISWESAYATYRVLKARLDKKPGEQLTYCGNPLAVFDEPEPLAALHSEF